MWDTDMTDQGARMWGELAHDEALRIANSSAKRSALSTWSLFVIMRC